jgi:hypothetical protein
MVSRSDKEKHHTFRGNARASSRGTANGRALSKKIMGPCKNCNEQWMSQIEASAKPVLLPMMHGVQRELGPDELALLSCWLSLKAMVWDWGQSLRAVPQSDRDFIRTNRAAPSDWRIWIGRTDAGFGFCGAFAAARYLTKELPNGLLSPMPDRNLPANTQAFILYSGAFLGMTFRSPFVSAGTFDDKGGGMLRSAWPDPTRFVWPSGTTVSVEEVPGWPEGLVEKVRRGAGCA